MIYTSGDKLVAGLACTLSLFTLIDRALAEWVALGLIILAGIPHGAFDLRAAETRWGFTPSRRAILLVCYIAVGLCMSALCLCWPGIGLILFLGISVFHFSEGERLHASKYTAMCIGTAAILLPISFNLSEASRYLEFFASETAITILGPCLVAGGVFLSLMLILCLSNDRLRRQSFDMFQYAACFFSWIALPPLSGFCVWFIGRHSRQHFERSRAYLSTGLHSLFSFDLVVLSILAIALLAPLAFWFDLTNIHQLFAASIILIAGLTLPHMLVTHLLGRRSD